MRSSKTTGKRTEKLTIWLCEGNKALKSTEDANAALATEVRLLSEGHSIDEPTVDMYFAEGLKKYNSGLGDNYVWNIKRMTPKEFNNWKEKEEKPKQVSF